MTAECLALNEVHHLLQGSGNTEEEGAGRIHKPEEAVECWELSSSSFGLAVTLLNSQQLEPAQDWACEQSIMERGGAHETQPLPEDQQVVNNGC